MTRVWPSPDHLEITLNTSTLTLGPVGGESLLLNPETIASQTECPIHAASIPVDDYDSAPSAPGTKTRVGKFSTIPVTGSGDEDSAGL
jgi:hypothetical protein